MRARQEYAPVEITMRERGSDLTDARFVAAETGGHELSEQGRGVMDGCRRRGERRIGHCDGL